MENIKKKLEDLESKYYYLQMIDHWDSSDYKYADELKEEIKRCKNALEE